MPPQSETSRARRASGYTVFAIAFCRFSFSGARSAGSGTCFKTERAQPKSISCLCSGFGWLDRVEIKRKQLNGRISFSIGRHGCRGHFCRVRLRDCAPSCSVRGGPADWWRCRHSENSRAGPVPRIRRRRDQGVECQHQIDRIKPGRDHSSERSASSRSFWPAVAEPKGRCSRLELPEIRRVIELHWLAQKLD